MFNLFPKVEILDIMTKLVMQLIFPSQVLLITLVIVITGFAMVRVELQRVKCYILQSGNLMVMEFLPRV